MIPAKDHPGLEMSLEGRMAESMVALLQADQVLVDSIGGADKIRSFDVEDLALRSGVRAPEIWVGIDEVSQDRKTGGTAEHFVTLIVLFVSQSQDSDDTRSQLRSRTIAHIRRLVRASEGGVLKDVGTGEKLAENLTETLRSRALRLLTDSPVVLTPVLFRFQAFIDELTEEVIYQ